ncbi:MAG: type II secretion system F family protein [Chthonomonadales bacterium]|nr:type II secretion system F family protein [Chthonomonadales bacterium]
MAEFQYVALDRSGRQVTGVITCRDHSDAAARVRGLGYYPVDLTPVGGRSSKAAPTRQARTETQPRAQERRTRGGRPTRVHLLLFTRELADLIDAGLPIDRALSVLLEQTDSDAMREMVRGLQEDIRAGKPLSEALGKYPREFPPLYANMIRAGEVAGQLPEVMTRLADFLEKEQVRRSQVIAALTYPAVLITVAVLAVTFLLTFVIPRLEDVFKELGAALPAPTRALLALSGFVAHQWWVIALVIAGAVFGFRTWVATVAGRRMFDGFRINVPLAGVLARKMAMARFTRTLGTLLAGGVPILESLDISGTAVGNTVVTASIAEARDKVRQGETLSSAMENDSVFLPLVVHMSAVGEETGRLAPMLVRTADTLDFEVDNAMRRLTSLVEPLVVLLMGGFVGFVVLSILLPIFQANTIVK